MCPTSANQQAKTIKARDIQVCDEAGHVVVEIKADKKGGRLDIDSQDDKGNHCGSVHLGGTAILSPMVIVN